jgi:hypothetical protein
MSNEDPKPPHNNDPSDTRDAAEKFVELAEKAIETIEAFLEENQNGKNTQTAQIASRIRNAADRLSLGNIREAHEAASAMHPTTDEERTHKRKVLPTLKKYRVATVQLDKFLTRKIVGGTRKHKKSKRNTRTRTRYE